jgi:putative transcriptional regulator
LAVASFALLALSQATSLSFAAAPKPAPPSAHGKHLTAILLVARAELPDSNFGGSTVLVMNDLGPAPVGIVINRPTRVEVSSVFPEVKSLAHLHDKVYFGGPVELDSMWFLFRAAKQPEHAVPAFDGVYLSASRDLLLKLLARDKPMEGLRIYAGHSGWAPGQLEAEIAHGDWKLEHADSAGLFSHRSEHPWPTQEDEESPKNNT